MKEKLNKAKEGLKNFKKNFGQVIKNFSQNLRTKIGKPGSKQNTKVIALAITGIVIVSLISSLAGGWILSHGLRNEKIGLENQVASLQTKMQAAQEEVSQYTAELRDKETEITSLKSQTSSLTEQFDSQGEQISNLQFELENKSNKLSAVQASLNTCDSERGEYLETIRNSVKAVCCSFSDVQQDEVKNWEIYLNNIVCNSGSLTVNCGTGVTDNPE